MPRELFPREADRAVIDRFLRKSFLKSAASVEAELSIANSKLKWRESTIAWYGEDGSLYMKLAIDAGYYPAKRVFEAVTTALGLEDVQIERTYTQAMGEERQYAYFVNGAATGLDEPIHVAGPLTIQVYRVQHNVARRGGK